MTSVKFKARLTIDVTYDIDVEECAERGLSPESVKRNLLSTLGEIPEWVSGEGAFTHHDPATVDTWTSTVDIIKDKTDG